MGELPNFMTDVGYCPIGYDLQEQDHDNISQYREAYKVFHLKLMKYYIVSFSFPLEYCKAEMMQISFIFRTSYVASGFFFEPWPII